MSGIYGPPSAPFAAGANPFTAKRVPYPNASGALKQDARFSYDDVAHTLVLDTIASPTTDIQQWTVNGALVGRVGPGWTASGTQTGSVGFQALTNVDSTPGGTPYFADTSGVLWNLSNGFRAVRELSPAGGYPRWGSVFLANAQTSATTSAYELGTMAVYAETFDSAQFYAKGMVAMEVHGKIGNGNMFGQVWGINLEAGNAGGATTGDGAVIGVDISTINIGTNVADPNTPNFQKVGLSLQANGSVPSSAAIWMRGATTWHHGVFMESAALGSVAGDTFLELRGRFTVDYTGAVTIGGLNSGAGWRKGVTLKQNTAASRAFAYVSDGTNTTNADEFYIDVVNADIHIRTGATGTTEVLRGSAAGGLSFLGATPITRPTVTGAKGSNTALGSLLTALASFGLITDSSTA